MEYGLIWNKVIGYFLPITEIENWDLIIKSQPIIKS